MGDGENTITLRDGGTDDVRSVFNSLSEKDRRFVAPRHPEFYGGATPDSRTVAYDHGRPIAFADMFDLGRFQNGKNSGRYSMEIAVSDDARGKGIGKRVAIKTIRDLLEKRKRREKVKDLVWSALRGNKESLRLAKSIGFNGFGGVLLSGWTGRMTPDEFRKKYMSDVEKKAEIELKDGKYKDAASRPSKEDLWRMYDIMQADARLAKKVEGLGFGRSGDAYRKAAIKLKVMELARVVKDGKKIRNNIAHMPGYVPSAHDAERAIRQYADAEKKLSEFV